MGIFIDCTRSPSAAAMRAAGVVGVSRYLSTLDSDPLGKIIHKPEYDSLIAAGFDVMLNWEHSARDWLGGAAAGRSHAAQAVAQARALGYPAGCVIVGSADFDMTAAQWSSDGKAYAQAYSAGVRAGGYTAGVYGPWDVLGWCRSLGGFVTYWQSMSTAFSGGRNAKPWPGVHLRQRRKTTIGGVSVDVSDIVQERYGQASVREAEADMDKDTLFYIPASDGLSDLTRQKDGGVRLADWVGWVTYTLDGVRHAKPPAAPIDLTPDQLQQLTADVAAQLGAKLDAVGAKVDTLLARLATAGGALDG